MKLWHRMKDIQLSSPNPHKYKVKIKEILFCKLWIWRIVSPPVNSLNYIFHILRSVVLTQLPHNLNQIMCQLAWSHYTNQDYLSSNNYSSSEPPKWLKLLNEQNNTFIPVLQNKERNSYL